MTLGVLNLFSDTRLEFSPTEINRVQILSALVAYEILNLERRVITRSPLSEDLGRVLRSAREELKLTQEDLAALVGTSRIALSGREAGSQPPSRGPLRRWAAALGLLGGGRAEIITVVDATPQLLEMLRRDPGRLSELSPEQFEILVAERLWRMGCSVQRTGATTLKDGGIDIIAVPKLAGVASFLLAVQVKHHRGSRPTGRDAVDRLLASQNTSFRLGMLVTNTRFTRDAIWTASRDPARHFLRLRDFADLTRWLHGVFVSDQEWREIPDSVKLAPGVLVQVPKPRFTEAGIVWPLKNT
jgi:transcriptional regulator with XRE-family HTH domain